jgi:predicted nucleic acid-binding protein
MQIIVDSSVLIDHLRGFKKATQKIDELKQSGSRYCISVITEAEVFSGKDYDSKDKRKDILDLLKFFRKINVDSSTAQKAAEFRRNYGVALDDCIIAATAFSEKCTIWTKNAEDFSKIKEVKVVEPY